MLERGIVAIVGQVASDEHKVDGGVLVHVINAGHQIFQWLGVVAVQVYVGYLCKGEWLLCSALHDADEHERYC